MFILVIIFGLIFGSFLNVVIHRLPRGESLAGPRSQCPSCRKTIAFYDNVPLLSFLLLRGRCRHCQVRIPVRYPLIEGITALCVALLYLRFGATFDFIKFSVLALFLIPISAIDLERRLILNKLTLPGSILGIVLVLMFQFEMWFNALLGAVAGGGFLLIIGFLATRVFKKESMGMGDVKLLAMIGIYVGFPNSLISLFFAMFVAAFFILGGMICKKIKLGDTIPFGPFIAIGTLAYQLIGHEVVAWYLGLLGL